MDDSVDADDGHALTVQEEKLYEEYLTARAEQAASTAREAARIAATQPGNRVKVKEAEQAKLAAAKVKADLAAQRAKLDEVTHTPPKTRVEAPAQAVAPPQDPGCAPSAKPGGPAQATPSPVGDRPVRAATSDSARIANASRPAAAPGTPAAMPKTAATPDANVAPTPARPKEVSPSHADRTKVAAPKLLPPTTNPSHTPRPSGGSGTEKAGTNEGGTAIRQAPAANSAPATERVNGASYAKTAAMPSQEAQARPKSASPMPAPAKTGDASLKPEPRTTAENDMPAPARPDPAAVAKSNAAVPTRHPVAAAKAAAAVQAQKLAQALRSAQAKKAVAKVKSPQPQRASASEACPADMARSQGLAQALAVQPQDTNPQPARTAAQAPEPNKANATPVPLASNNTADGTRPAQPQQTAPVTRADAGTAGFMAEQPRIPQATATRAGNVAARRADKARATSDATPRNGAAHAPHPESAQTTVSAPATHAEHELQAALETLTARAPTAAPDESPQGVATPDGASTPEPHVPDAAPVSMPDSAGPTVATPAEIPQQSDVKDCPNCTALLPIDTERCRCGFVFARVEERMPSLSLSDSDVAALDGTMPSGRITPLG
jgi:hypothetical protein